MFIFQKWVNMKMDIFWKWPICKRSHGSRDFVERGLFCIHFRFDYSILSWTYIGTDHYRRHLSLTNTSCKMLHFIFKNGNNVNCFLYKLFPGCKTKYLLTREKSVLQSIWSSIWQGPYPKAQRHLTRTGYHNSVPVLLVWSIQIIYPSLWKDK